MLTDTLPLYTENQMEQKMTVGMQYNTSYFHVRDVARTHAHTHTGVPYRDTQINPNTVTRGYSRHERNEII